MARFENPAHLKNSTSKNGPVATQNLHNNSGIKQKKSYVCLHRESVCLYHISSNYQIEMIENTVYYTD